jgi:hypothetical protein
VITRNYLCNFDQVVGKETKVVIEWQVSLAFFIIPTYIGLDKRGAVQRHCL